MRKNVHPGSTTVIGAQLLILFILTVSLCVQSRKAAAENTYAVMEESGEGSPAGEAGDAKDAQKKKYIHWVEFQVPADVMEKAFHLDMGTVQEKTHLNWVELLAYLGANYGGNFELFRQADLDAVVEKLKSGASMEEIAKNMKYYAYYREAYGAVLDGMVGYFEQETGSDKVWLTKYGLKAFSPIAKNFPYSDFDDFGASRSYGFKRKHLGHDMMGQVGTTENTNNITTPHLHFGLQLIFDESQKEGNNEIWINCYELVKFLRLNQSETVKVEGTKEWRRVYGMKDPGIPGEGEQQETFAQSEPDGSFAPEGKENEIKE